MEVNSSKLTKLHKDILELETENMVPVLEAIGIKHDPDKLLEGLMKPQEIVTVYRDDTLLGLLRYSLIAENIAKVWSIQIKNPIKNRLILRSLLKKVYTRMKEQNIREIVSVVQKSNNESIKFHQKMNFQIEKEFEKAIQFKIQTKSIFSKLGKKL